MEMHEFDKYKKIVDENYKEVNLYELEDDSRFYIEPNLIIVKEVTKQNIIKSIIGVCSEFNFLQKLKKEEDIDLSKYINVY